MLTNPNAVTGSFWKKSFFVRCDNQILASIIKGKKAGPDQCGNVSLNNAMVNNNPINGKENQSNRLLYGEDNSIFRILIKPTIKTI